MWPWPRPLLGSFIIHCILLPTMDLTEKTRSLWLQQFKKIWFWALGPLGLPIFHHCTKFGAKKSWSTPKLWPKIETPRWRPSAILDFRKSDFWALVPLGLPIFYLGVKFGDIDAEIMAQNRNPRWRPSAIIIGHHRDPKKAHPWPKPHLHAKFGADRSTGVT